MGFLAYMKDFVTLASIASLFMIGLLIALKSGVVSLGTDRCQVFLGNLSHTVIAVAGCLLLMIMLQQLIGLRVAFP